MKTPVLASLLILVSAVSAWPEGNGEQEVIVEIEEVTVLEPRYDLFEDDRLEEKEPGFDPELFDSRSVGDSYENLWQINASAAVVGLDVPEIRDIDEGYLHELYPSYASAAAALAARGKELLPSVNMLDGKVKQFDDGLYAELDAGLTFGGMSGFNDTSAMLESILGKLDRGGKAYAWVWGGLKIGGEAFPTPDHGSEPEDARGFMDIFENSPLESKPVGFYTWSDELERTFRMLRYFQKRWAEREGVPDEIAGVLSENTDILKRYRTVLDFYARLTNPLDALSFADLAHADAQGKSLEELWMEKGLEPKPGGATVHLLPYSTSRETVLFNRLSGGGMPSGADLMIELVTAIRDGRVDLAPGENSGWYDYQVFALETFLLPERGSEHDKLLLTKKYKERMLQAFEALVTKRRETHIRQLGTATLGGPPPEITLRLRVEPNPTYYLRTARSYAFLKTYLEAVVPGPVLDRLSGRREGGQRAMPLAGELTYMRDLFYGFHLVSCEDIGLRPELSAGELDGVPGGAEACMSAALAWLETFTDDPDLAVDTRVSVPIAVDAEPGTTTLWCTLGVRGAKLRAWYARPPKLRPVLPEGEEAESAAWEDTDEYYIDVKDANYVILVDEFAEVTLKGHRSLTREELRAACDEHRTKEAIVRALSR